MQKTAVLMCMFFFILAACNTPPSRIAPVYQNNNKYASLDCKRLTKQLSQLDTIISAQKSQLQTDANIDTGIVAGSLILAPIALVALAATGNGDLKNEYARNLGKQAALRDAIEAKDCETYD